MPIFLGAVAETRPPSRVASIDTHSRQGGSAAWPGTVGQRRHNADSGTTFALVQVTIRVCPYRHPPVPPRAPAATVRRGDGRKSRATAACGKIIEVSIPFDELGCEEGAPLDLYVMSTSAGEIVQQAPDSAPIRVFRPTEDFERIVWLV